MKLTHAAASAAFLLASFSSIHAQAGQYLYGGYEDLGGGTPGYQNLAPELTGFGTCHPGAQDQMMLTGAIPSSGLSMVTGYLMNPQPLFGGVLWPNPDIVIPMSTDAAGNATLSFTWPNFSPGVPLYFQAAVYDPYAAEGMSFSNLVRGETAGWGFYEDRPLLVTYPVAQLADCVTFKGIPRVQLTLTNAAEGIQEAARADAQGFCAFPNLPIQSGVTSDPLEIPGSKIKTRVVGLAEAPGYVPIRKEIWFTEDYTRRPFWLVPLASGQVTPLITASVGGTYTLPGLGDLFVPPNVLSQDARIRVVEIPPVARNPHPAGEEIRYQVWIGAEDAQGNELPNALPSSNSAGITLTAALPYSSDLANVQDLEANCYTYEAHQYEPWLNKSQIILDHNISGDIRLGKGHTEIRVRYHWDARCNCGPWKLQMKVVNVANVAKAGIPIDCGEFGKGITVKAEDGQEKVHGWSAGADLSAKLKWEGNLIFASAEAEAGITIHGNVSGSTVTSKVTGVAETVVNGDLYRKRMATSQCMDACYEIGFTQLTVTIRAYRSCPNPSLICPDSILVGTLTFNSGLSSWLRDPVLRTNCDPSCANLQSLELTNVQVETGGLNKCSQTIGN